MADDNLATRLERLEAVHEIQNLMGRYSYLHTANKHEETVALWAQHTPGTMANIPSFGLYKGIDGIRKLYIGAHQVLGEEARIGEMHMHTLTTPVIEVAGDGKTARGVWISPGQETPTFGGQPKAHWAWLKYGADFVKEGGEWKFWHLQVYGLFFTPYEKSWVEQSIVEEPIELPEEMKPDRKTTYWTSYTPTIKQELIPAPPQPYETWDDSMSCIIPDPPEGYGK